MDSNFQISDIKSLIKSIIRRRKKAFFLIFIILFVFISSFAFILPSIFLSKATILVEAQQIPDEYVMSTVRSYVEERLDLITRQVMSRTKLIEIIDKFNLYPDLRESNPIEMILKKMQDDISLQTINTHIKDRRSGRSESSVVAFSVSYEGKEPEKVQKVAHTLASLYLEEESKAREKLTTGTTQFFEEEMENLRREIRQYEEKIKRFKEAHIGELPEHSNMNLQRFDRIEREIDGVISRIRTVEERKVFLKGQIATVEPLVPVVIEGDKVAMNPQERLKRLRLQLISLQSKLSAKHPDIKKLKREISELEAQVGKSDDTVLKVKRLADLNGQLAEMKGRLGPKHPDVIKLKRERDILSREVDALMREKTVSEVSEEKPDNATYINLMTQIATADIEIKGLREEKQKLEKEKKEYQRKLENAPIIEKEYNELTRDYENAKRKYDDLSAKRLEAKIAQGMEDTQRGEKFTIIDDAHVPQKPYKPNRVMIVILAFVLSFGVSSAFAAVQEGLDNSLKTLDEIKSITGLPVLSTLSLIETEQEIQSKRIKRILILFSTLGVIVIALLLFNRYVMPLDELWEAIYRRVILVW